MCRTLFVLLALGAFAFSPVALARTFTDNQGNKVNAKFVRVHQGNVVLNRGGRVVTVPFSNLSPEDQDYIRGEMEAKGKGDLLPPVSRRPGSADLALPGLEAVDFPDAGRMDAARTWTDAQGRTMEAQFVGMSGEKVVLLKEGRRTTYPFEGLSPADQQYVRGQMVVRGQGHLVPGGLGEAGAATGSMPGMPGMPGMMPGMPGSMPGTPGSMPGMPGMPGMPAEMSGMPADDPTQGVYGHGAPTSDVHMPLGDPSLGTSSSPMPDMPTTSDPVATWSGGLGAPSLPQIEMEYGECGKCGKRVSASLGAGDRCPHCGVVWDVEETADGRIIDAKGRQVSQGWYRIGGAGGLAAIVGAVIGLLAHLFKGRN